MLTEDIIPIAYMGGTGGRFLCHFIVSAKQKNKEILKLSTHGNAHEYGLRDISPTPYKVTVADIDKINFILNQTPIDGSIKPYYTASHMWDLKLATSYFKKIIKITYKLENTVELSKIMFGKWHVDTTTKNQYLSSIQSKLTTPLLKPKFLENQLKLYVNKFKEEDISNVLFISWEELFKGNINDLLTKLSTFTNIDINNFSKESILHWRIRTQYCIDTFNEI
jgi:hypothetical protein